MATRTIPEENSTPQLTRHEAFPQESSTSPQFDLAGVDSLGLAAGFIDYLTETSNDGLSEFSLQHFGKASECALAFKRNLSQIVDAIIDQKEAERRVARQSAADGHRRRQQVLVHEMVTALWSLAEDRIQHLVLKHLADLMLQLPTNRRAPVKPVPPIPTKQANEATPATQTCQTAENRIKKLVDRRVVEVLADPNDFAFGGWFRERARSNEIRKHQSADDRGLWTRYFDAWGCVCCEAKDAAYGGCGFCARCYARMRARITTIRQAQRC